MTIRAEGPQTLPIVLLAGAKPQDFCCPSFQLLLQVCRHFDAEAAGYMGKQWDAIQI